MRKLSIILFLFFSLSSCKVLFGQSPQAPIPFATIEQMEAYNGTYRLGAWTDSTLGGMFYLTDGSFTPDDINVISSGNANRFWIRFSASTSSVSTAGSGKVLIFNTIADLAASTDTTGDYANVLGYYSANDGGGGAFYKTTSSAAQVNGMVVRFAGDTTKKWFRSYLGTKLNVKWLGAYGDSTHNDWRALQLAWDYAKQYANYNSKYTLYFPKGNYTIDTPIHAWSYIDVEGESQTSTSIINTLPQVEQGPEYACVFFGEMTPASFSRLRVKDFDSLSANRIWLHTATDKDSFHVDSIIMARGLTYFQGGPNEIIKYFWLQMNVIDSIVQEGGKWVLVGRYPFDSTFTTAGKVSNVAFTNGSMDDWNYPFYAITDVDVKNIRFKSNGQWRTRTTLMRSNWENVTSDGAESFGGNLMQYHTYKNCTSFWWKQVVEFSYMTNHCTFDNLRAFWKNDDFLVDGQQPMVRFGENTRYVNFLNSYIEAGLYDGGTVAFDDVTNSTVDNNEIRCPECVTGIEFNNGKDSTVNYNNVYSRNRFFGGRAIIPLNFIKNGFTGATLNNNSVWGNQFYGAIRGGAGTFLNIAGTNNSVYDNFFEQGEQATADSLVSGCKVYRNNMPAPFTKMDISLVDFFENYRYGVKSFKAWTDSSDKSNIGIGSNPIVNVELQPNAIGNIAIGNTGVMDSLSAGHYTIGIGDSTLRRNHGGEGVIAIGFAAGRVTDSIDHSIFIGYQSGYNTTHSGGSVAIGYQAMANNTTGQFNTVIGDGAGVGATGATYGNSVIIGRQAAPLINGGSNVIIGSGAAAVLDTGMNNVIIGRLAGLSAAPSTLHSNVTIIGSGITLPYNSTNSLNLSGVMFAQGITSTDSTFRNSMLHVGIGTRTPDASAILDLQNTNYGFAVPRMTTTQREAIVSPAPGLMVYDTTLGNMCMFDDVNNVWKRVQWEAIP